MRRVLRRLVLGLLAVGLGALIVYAFRPQPVGVDLAAVSRGPLRLTVDEDGKTRLKNRYVVSSPLDGELQRVPWKAGDAFAVAAGHTAAVLLPRPPSLLDPREREGAEARAAAAGAAREQAAANLKRAQVAHEYARAEQARGRAAGRGLSPQELENLELKQRSAAETERAARHALAVAEYELQVARVALKYHKPRSPGEGNGAAGGEGPQGGGSVVPEIRIPFPIERGRVLRVHQESRSVVTAGQKVLEVGDPADLECEIDVLSADAVRIAPGAAVALEHWGGERPLAGRVRLVEPAGFTKVSALGVEEQRVWVVVDFVDPPEARRALGDGYRVDARVVVWEGQDVLKVPSSALFRHGDGWAAYVAEGGRARLRAVEVGKNNGLEAQVLGGLAEGEQVVVHPGDKVRDGVGVVPRQ